MRLYLSSHRFGRHADALQGLVGRRRNTLVIGNALDYIPAAARAVYTATTYDPVAALNDMGMPASWLDLRDYVGSPIRLHDQLSTCGLVWVLGGNAFVLRRAMRASGFDGVIHGLLAQDALVYGGSSAGAIVTAPTLRGLDLMDDPTVGTWGDEVISYEGLNLFPKSVVPHVASGHRDSAGADKAAHWLTDQGMPFVALQDGQVIVVEGGTTTLLP
ncbi:Type 1 glutamine amidotransferase-like domain-containing protein [Loktanella sp. M215]|uniref:Type 1 glutamine amidotransferase-like domain-containing protein n=1 Tax=Loktanella sp. M215 TaxID=2675431 RepID=UPI001F382266|nr:Type 1 glutamine amidotransferase-like domain-containing protein [Loktanella sp. M215]MCF7700356.1 peptidase E [Loktanella sp. M215]